MVYNPTQHDLATANEEFLREVCDRAIERFRNLVEPKRIMDWQEELYIEAHGQAIDDAIKSLYELEVVS